MRLAFRFSVVYFGLYSLATQLSGGVILTRFYHDSTFDGEVIEFLRATSLDPTRTGVHAPWQNGIAERWLSSCRRELLDHIIALNERHLSRLIRGYVACHHHDRIHDALEKDATKERPVAPKPSARARDVHRACGRSAGSVLVARRGVGSGRSFGNQFGARSFSTARRRPAKSLKGGLPPQADRNVLSRSPPCSVSGPDSGCLTQSRRVQKRVRDYAFLANPQRSLYCSADSVLTTHNAAVRGDGHVPGALDEMPKPVVVALVRPARWSS